jgi:hypothetical protein
VHALVQQLPTLLGVLVGVLATWIATSAAERARWRRDQSVRWDEKRLAAYTEYSHAVKQMISAATRLQEQRSGQAGLAPARARAALAAGEAALAAAEDERTVKWESVLMLGSSNVITMARAWHQSAFRLEWIALGRASDASWDEAIEATSQARRAYYQAAKADLGVSPGSEPEVYEWQLAKMAKAAAKARDLPGQASDEAPYEAGGR